VAPIEAIFQGGVFKPLGEVMLPENQRVKLQIEPIDAQYARDWLERVRNHQQEMLERHGGYFPDSTLDIAEDRMRDV
jgi:predicted DNA-binding antitoxin AbrB/MazE fold protein